MFDYNIKDLLNYNYIPIIITVVIICVILYVKYYNKYNNNGDLITVKSTIDGKTYLVRNLKDSMLGANSLALLKNKLVEIVNYMYKKYPSDDRIKRLKNNFDPNTISESLPDSKYTSFTVNKGEKLVFCIRQRDENNNLVKLNTLVFVGIHELAHLMSKTVGHNDEFWNNMKFLLKEVLNSNMNIYQYQPFHNEPEEYCGTTITDTPVKK
jgi:hypothetical protein